MYMLWTSLGCLILSINSIVWNDNVINSAPVWCDISKTSDHLLCLVTMLTNRCAGSRYLIGASVGIPASSLCIIRRLYYMTKLQTISIEKEEVNLLPSCTRRILPEPQSRGDVNSWLMYRLESGSHAL